VSGLEEARRACDWLSLPASPETPAEAFYQLGELLRLRGERCFRDVHTAAQYLPVQEGRWETTGRVLMGLDPGGPLL